MSAHKLKDNEWALQRFKSYIDFPLNPKTVREGRWYAVNRQEDIIRGYNDIETLMHDSVLRNKEIWIAQLKEGEFTIVTTLNQYKLNR